MDKFLLVRIIYGAATIQGLFLFFLLFRAKINQPANKILSILVGILSLHLILVGFDDREFFMALPHLSRISWIVGTLYGPLIFLFVQYLTQTQPDKFWKSLWLFVPFITMLIIMLPYYMLSAEEKRAVITDFEKSSAEDFGWINQAVSIVQILFALLSLLYYLYLERRFYEEYSQIEHIRIKWLKQFLIFIFCIVFLGVFIFFAKIWQLQAGNFYHFHFIGVVFLFYWLSYKALTNPVIFGLQVIAPAKAVEQEKMVDEESSAKYARSAIDEERLHNVFNSLQNILREEQFYKKNDLTLTQLSQRLGIPRHHISQSINALYKGNFFDLINDFRIEEFKRLAKDPSKKHLSLLGIASEAGFNSKATFYSVFKKKTGKTPSEYIESGS